MNAELLSWFRKLRSVAQYGLTYSKDPFDRERFQAVQGVATQIAAQLVQGELAGVERTLAAEVSVPTPKLDVRAAVFEGDAILLVRESSDGLWSLPGGWVDGRRVALARCRARDQRGVRLRLQGTQADRGLGPQPAPAPAHAAPRVQAVLSVRAHWRRSTPEPRTTQIGFFALDQLPALSTARVLREQIECAFRHRAEPGLPTEFD